MSDFVVNSYVQFFACESTVVNWKKLTTKNQCHHPSHNDCWLLGVLKKERKDHELGRHGPGDAHLERVPDEWIRSEPAASGDRHELFDSLARRKKSSSVHRSRAGSRRSTGCPGGRQTPLSLKLKTKAAFLLFKPEIVAILRLLRERNGAGLAH
jgi:hypothetical protein